MGHGLTNEIEFKMLPFENRYAGLKLPAVCYRRQRHTSPSGDCDTLFNGEILSDLQTLNPNPIALHFIPMNAISFDALFIFLWGSRD